jgi:hypothetical protein
MDPTCTHWRGTYDTGDRAQMHGPLLAAWGTTPDGPPDLDGDGSVGMVDLLILLQNWG